MLKPSQTISHDIIVQVYIQDHGTSHTENKYSLDYFTRLIIMNEYVRAEKSYKIDTCLTTLVTEHGWNKDNCVNLATTSKSDF